jgi:hypothetical protein
MKRKIEVPEQMLRMYKVYRSDIMEIMKRPTSRKVSEREEKGRCEGKREGFILAFALCNKISNEQALAILIVLCVQNDFLTPIPFAFGCTNCIAEWTYNDSKKITKNFDLIVTEREYETFHFTD